VLAPHKPSCHGLIIHAAAVGPDTIATASLSASRVFGDPGFHAQAGCR
jgi:hypothetical protein